MPDSTDTLPEPDHAAALATDHDDVPMAGVPMPDVSMPDVSMPDRHETPPDPARDLRLQTARRDITERRRITQRLRQALSSGGLVLHYQPQFHLNSGRLRGAEAMIRLAHRRRGLILPNRFMPIAEHSEVIHDIGGWALLHACREAARWPAPLLVAIGLSARQLQSTRLIKYLIEALARSGLPANRIELELTESMLTDDSSDVFFSLKAIIALGVRIAIDDFGIGYASLGVLKRLPHATLKLDRSLIQNLAPDSADSAIIHAAAEAGHALGFSILADGVETAEQCEILKTLGCDEGQGPHFGPPAPAENLPLT